MVSGANQFVPAHRKNFSKFWWDEGLNLLKQEFIDSYQLWKAAGKPRHGSIFEKRQACKLKYRQRIRQGQNSWFTSYSNDLHDALMHKQGPNFWNCWNSKFDRSSNACEQVDGTTDCDLIVDKFVKHFESAYVILALMQPAPLNLKMNIQQCATLTVVRLCQRTVCLTLTLSVKLFVNSSVVKRQD